MASKAFYAVVAGVGPGTGAAVALRFAKAYPVVVLARKPESYNDVVADIKKSGGKAIGISTDIADPESVASAFATIKKELPNTKLAAAIYNVGGVVGVKPFLESSIEEIDASLQSNPRGLYNFAKASLPLLLESTEDSSYPPTLLVTGATASLKGSARFGLFAAGKFAKRALAQSLAREFGPKGVHVAHVIVDGIIDIPRTAQREANGGAPDGKLKPDQIAENYWFLHTQHRSAFTQELDLRPYVEKF